MFYSNLFKGVAVLAMIFGLTACGGVKTDEVVLEDCVKISEQRFNFFITEEIDDGETECNVQCRVLVETLQDPDWRASIKMKLCDEVGAELIYLKCSDIPEEKGEKKWVDFGLTWGNSGRSKSELENILKQTKSVKFVGEDLIKKD